MIPVCWQLLANISSLASSTPSAVLDLSYIWTQAYITSLCHRQLLLMGTDLICGRHQLSHIFPLSQKVDTTSNPVIGEGVNVIALLWLNIDAQFMDGNLSLVLACPHAIHSWCRPVYRKADIILTDCYANNVSVIIFWHQNSIRPSSFCRMIGMYEDHRVRLLEYRGQIHLGRACGCWWNLLLISMIIFSHCFWEKCASWMEFCTCLTPFISLTSSLTLTWLQFSNYLTCISVEHNVRPIVL